LISGLEAVNTGRNVGFWIKCSVLFSVDSTGKMETEEGKMGIMGEIRGVKEK